jgi:hypothetical protein
MSGVFGVHHWDLAIEQYLGIRKMVVYWDTMREWDIMKIIWRNFYQLTAMLLQVGDLL